MGWLSKKKTEDSPMTPEQLRKLYPDCIAQMEEQWKAENAPAPAPDPEDGNGDGGDGEPVDPPPSTEPATGASDSNNEESATPTGASVATGGAASVSRKENPMADSKKAEAPSATASVAATLEELEAKFPDDPAFVIDCLRGKLGMAQAMEARNQQLAAQVTALKSKLAAAEADEANLNAGAAAIGGAPQVTARPGTVTAGKPVQVNGKAGAGRGGKPAAVAEPTAEKYLEKVAEVMVEKEVSRGEAIALVNKNHPELRAAYCGRSQA